MLASLGSCGVAEMGVAAALAVGRAVCLGAGLAVGMRCVEDGLGEGLF
jgi:hypothetical protein